MTLDVVVVNFGSAPLIERTITVARELGGEAAGVIVVDNSPGDGAAEIVRCSAPGATLITNTANRGYAAAVNQAMAVATADIVLLLNPDVQLISGRFADVVAAFGEPRVAAVATRLVDSDGNVQQSAFRTPRLFDLISEDVALAERFPGWARPRRFRMLDWDHADARPVDAVTGACLFLRRSAYAEVGPFDERFFVYYEETDWLIRAKRHGWRTLYLPTLEAVHRSAGSSPGVASRPSLLLLESQHRYARKHYGRAGAGVLRAGMLGIDTARLARRALDADPVASATARDRIRVHLGARAPRPPSPAGDVEYVDSLDAIAPADWRRLSERAGHVFSTPEWLGAWWLRYGNGRRPLIGLARRGGELVAIVPLYVWWRRGLAVLRFMGHGPSDQLGPICAPLTDPDAAAAVAGAVAAIPFRRFALLAELVPADQRFGQLVGGRTLYTDANPVLRLEGGSWEDFLRARGANFRQQMRRFPRKLAELGAVSYRLVSDPAALDEDLDILFDLHRRRWGGADTQFLLAEGFHREVAARALEQGWLRLWFLEIDGRPVAALHGFRFAGAESAYQSGRDPGISNHPVGLILLAHAIRHALADGMREYRLLRGDAGYKARFATHDPGLETSALPRGADAELVLAAAAAARGHSLGLRRHILDRI